MVVSREVLATRLRRLEHFVHALLGRLDDLAELGRVLGQHILKTRP